jgi:hypothetical protein
MSRLTDTLDNDSKGFLIVALSLVADLPISDLVPDRFSTIETALEFQGRCSDLVYLLGTTP